MGKSGGQAGNQNARKHGIYSRRLTEKEKLRAKEVEGVEGLDDEIAMLRVKLGNLFEDQPDRIDLQIKAINMIARLVKTRHSITPEDQRNLKNAIDNVLRDVAIPLGLKFIPMSPDEEEEWDDGEGQEPEVS